jgi:hypothetical protein
LMLMEKNPPDHTRQIHFCYQCEKPAPKAIANSTFLELVAIDESPIFFK